MAALNATDQTFHRLSTYLLAYVANRFRNQVRDPEDIVQATLVDLQQWAAGRNNVGEDELRAVATTICKRRIADYFRSLIPPAAEALLKTIPSGAATPEEEILVRRALRICLREAAKLSETEARLILGHTRSPMKPADRQRRKRLRNRLREVVQNEIGVDLGDLFPD